MQSLRLTYAGAIFWLLGLSAVLVLGFLAVQGSAWEIASNPTGWLRGTDTSYLSEVLATAAETMLAILGIAITVVAIVVELAANRYNHRISGLFIREPINIAVLSFFVVTTIVCFFAAATLSDPAPQALFPHAGFVLAVFLVTSSLLIVLPYFAFVISFVSPLNMIEKIRQTALAGMAEATERATRSHVLKVNEAIDELHDVVRSAMEQSDRAVAIAGIDALASIVIGYQELRPRLPDSWFQIDETIANDADFVSQEPFVLREIEQERVWLEVKALRQYLLLLTLSATQMRDIAYLIAINTRRIAVVSIESNKPLLRLTIRCFNSYLRSTINSGDMRTSYYLLNQYRMIAESINEERDPALIETIAHYLQLYGHLAFGRGQAFIFEVAAYDVVRLLEHQVARGAPTVDSLLRLLLDFDRDVERAEDEAGQMGVRRAQIQAAAMLLDFGDEERATRIAQDLAGEDRRRLNKLRDQLRTENRAQFWELTDRGVNFGYLEPGRRALLDRVFGLIDELGRCE